jgi:two-component system, LytTR family, response regulator LytT
MRILIAEDEAIIAESLYQVLLQLGYTPLEPAATSEEAIESMINFTPDIAVVDIHIGNHFSGFKVAGALNKKNIPFIFLTALYDKETVSMAQQFNPAAYLVKPFNKENLFATIELAVGKHMDKKKEVTVLPQMVFVKNGSQSISLPPAEITHLEAANKYVTIYLSTAKKHLVRGSLNEVTGQLQLHSLMQVHKSFVVNLQYIKAVKYDELLINGSIIPVGRTYREELKKRLIKV